MWTTLLIIGLGVTYTLILVAVIILGIVDFHTIDEQ